MSRYLITLFLTFDLYCLINKMAINAHLNYMIVRIIDLVYKYTIKMVEVNRLLYLLLKINQQRAMVIMICYHKLVTILKTMH